MFPFKSILDFNVILKEEHEVFRKTVREFVEKELEPRIKEIEEKNEFPKELIERAKELGFPGIGIPAEYGGQGGGALELVILIEEISRVCPAFAIVFGVNHLFTTPVLLFGNEEQKKKYIPPVAKGEVFAAHANTEPGAGSDVAGIQTNAKKEGNYWILNGRKIFITGAEKAQYFVVSARTSPPPSKRERWKGLSFFIVERDYPGFKIGSKINVIGLRGEQPYEIILDNVKVPEENLLGKEGEGFKIAVTTYDHGRLGIAAQALGIIQGVFEKSLNYSLQRYAFERPIISFEGIAFKIADMLTELEACRLLTYWAATLADKNSPEYLLAASMAKMYVTEIAEKASSLAIKIHGGYGVDKETGIERYLRDSLITTIYEGTNEIQRITLVRMLIRNIFGATIDII